MERKREFSIFLVAMGAIFLSFALLIAFFSLRERSRRWVDLEYRVWQVSSIVSEYFLSNRDISSVLDKDVYFYGFYDARGLALSRSPKAPASIDLKSLPNNTLTLEGGKIQLLRRIGRMGLERGMPPPPMVSGDKPINPGRGGFVPPRPEPLRAFDQVPPPKEPQPRQDGTKPLGPREEDPVLYMELYSGSYERMELLYGVGSLGLIVAILLIYLVIVSLYKKTLRFAETTERNREIIQLGTAARTLAHEIKNPLGVIKLQCSTLSRVLPADYAASLQIIDTEAARMHELCDRIGDFLRSGAGQPERIDLAEALKQIAVKNGIGLESSLRPHAVVEIDRIRLESLLGNLIENALDASGRDPQKVRLVASSQGRNVSVDVVDQGPGVSAETAPRIFDLFFTTKARGSGIGLPVARRFAEAAGGNLALRDTGPGGSTFRLSLPLCPRRGAGK
jgi:hypothetical protein